MKPKSLTNHGFYCYAQEPGICSTNFYYLSCGGLHTVSISGCIKWLHTVLANLLNLPKAVAYNFHKRLHTRLGNLVGLGKLCNLE